MMVKGITEVKYPFILQVHGAKKIGGFLKPFTADLPQQGVGPGLILGPQGKK
jgi:hypothetical protein